MRGNKKGRWKTRNETKERKKKGRSKRKKYGNKSIDIDRPYSVQPFLWEPVIHLHSRFFFCVACRLISQQGTRYATSMLKMFCSGLYYRAVALSCNRAVASGTYELLKRGLYSAVVSSDSTNWA